MLDAIRWDTALIRRYELTTPRYKSYPDEEQFTPNVGSFEVLHALRDSQKAGHPLSLYLHLPFCANLCYYCTSNKVITKDRGRARLYLEHLEKEIAMVARHLGPQQRVEQLHFGGGTPTFLSHAELRGLMACLRSHFNLLDDDHGDYGIEVDPREADWQTMGLLRELGFNRVSFSVQALDPEVQLAINRLQSLEQTRTIIEAARTLQYRSINVDLLYGLPKQTPQRFAHTVEAMIELQPDRLTLYNHDYRPDRYSAHRRINSAELPSVELKLEMLQGCVERLTAAGYRYIGMNQFVLPDDELAMIQEDGNLQYNLLGYAGQNQCDLIGLGVSAISRIGNLYSQNHSDLTSYQQSLDYDQLPTWRGLKDNADDHLRRAVIQSLICRFELDIPALEKTYGINFLAYFANIHEALQQMSDDGLLKLDAQRLEILPQGRLLAQSICQLFDRHRPLPEPQLMRRAL